MVNLFKQEQYLLPNTTKLRTYKSPAVAKMGDHGHNRHGPKRGGLLCPIRGGAGSPSNTMWPGPRSTSVISDVFIHPAVWPQQTWAENQGLCSFQGKLRPHRTQRRLGRRLPPYQVAQSIQPFGHKRTLAENWEAVPFQGRGAGSPSNTMSPMLSLPPYQVVF